MDRTDRISDYRAFHEFSPSCFDILLKYIVYPSNPAIGRRSSLENPPLFESDHFVFSQSGRLVSFRKASSLGFPRGALQCMPRN